MIKRKQSAKEKSFEKIDRIENTVANLEGYARGMRSVSKHLYDAVKHRKEGYTVVTGFLRATRLKKTVKFELNQTWRIKV